MEAGYTLRGEAQGFGKGDCRLKLTRIPHKSRGRFLKGKERKSVMKKEGRLAALLAALLLTIGTTPVLAGENPAQGGLDVFGNIGQESNEIISPQGLVPDTRNLVALDDLGISIAPKSYEAIRQTDGFVYVYTMTDGSMPYVIVGVYDVESDDFTGLFTDYMSGNYSDLQVSSPAEDITIGGNVYQKIGYTYTVSGYTVQDTRMFFGWNGRTYMFGAKEVPALGYLLGEGFLEQTAGSFAPLAGGGDDYPKHVDSTHSVTGGSIPDLGGLGDDVLTGGGGDDGGLGDENGGGETTGSEGSPSGESGEGDGSSPVGGVGGESSPQEEGTIMFDESLADYEGVWVPFEDGFRLYLPKTWNVLELTDEQKQDGVLYAAGDVSGTSENPPYISVTWTYADNYGSLDAVIAELEGSDYVVDGRVMINGIEAVTYTSETDDVSGVMFFQPLGEPWLFAAVGGEFSENVDVESAVLCSLSPYQP